MKKIVCLCILAALCLCVLLPGRVQAVQTSGTCGKGATWSFDTMTGTLTISGTGRIDLDYQNPWSDIKSTVTRIVIEEGITYLCEFAFSEFSEVKEVVLPESISAIGQWAFQGCTKLESINLHDKIEEIGPTCFAGTALTEVTLPKGIKRIEGGTFLNCINLTKVICQNETIQVDDSAFKGCVNLTEITLQGGGITDIGRNAFDGCVKLKNIPLDGDLYRISKEAFRGCTSLTELTLPDGVGYLYENAFAFSGLQRITLGRNVHDIDDDAFKDCPSLKFIKVDPENPYFHSDENGGLYSTTHNTLLKIPEGFSGTFTVRDGTRLVGSYAASNCMNLTDLVVPDSVEEIGDHAFENCKNLKSITLPDNLDFIANGAFWGCNSLTTIDFPWYIQAIGDQAFGNCENLTDITFHNIVGIDSNTFFNVTATVHYPSYRPDWANLLHNYGGQLTWEPYDCESHDVFTFPALEPTCTTEGHTEFRGCRICGITLLEAERTPAAGHTYGVWEIVDSSAEGVLVKRSCEACGHTEQKPLDESYSPQTNPSGTPTSPEDTPTEPSGSPSDPTQTPTDPTQTPTDAPTEPTQVPDDLTQQDIMSESPEKFPWVLVIVGILAVASAGTAGFLFGRKRK